VRFLRELNQASNNLNDTFASAGLDVKLASGDSLQINAALTSFVAQLEGYIRQVNETAAPAEVRETAEIKAATSQSAFKFQTVIQSLRAAIQAGNAAEITRLVPQLDALERDPEVTRPDTLQQALLTKYNIPDAQVNYRRLK
jgi:hypothetical protein